MRQELDVDWGILTNGSVFEVLTKSRQRNGGEEVSVVRFDLDDLAENPEVLELLSKESIRSGRADEIANQVAKTNEAIRYLRENEDDVTESVWRAVEKNVGDVPIDLEEQAREFVQNLASILQEQRQFVSDDQEPQQEDQKSTVDSDDFGLIEPKRNRVSGTIRRNDIAGEADARVAVFPTKKSGLPFLVENEAWGFVRIGSEFDYVAMYVTGDVREVQYFAEVEDVVKPSEANLQRPPEDYKDGAKIAEDKMVIEFSPGSLKELEDPVPFETKYPQSLRYTKLGELRTAETTDDLF